MRVLFFSTAFPQPHDPHRAPYNLQRCRALAAMHDVAVMSPRRWTERSARTADADAFRRQPTMRAFADVRYPTYVYPPGLHAQHARCLWWSCRREATALLRAFAPDVVVSYWSYPDGHAAQQIAAAGGTPAVAIVGGSDVLLARGPQRARIQRVLLRADAVVAVSDDLKQRIAELGVDASSIYTTPPAVDRQLFTPGDRDQARRRLGLPPSRPILLSIGRMVAVKGLITLIDAGAAVAAVRKDVLLCLVGDGPQRSMLAARVAAAGLDDVVRFIGPLTASALPDWYRAADVTVCPSLSEGTPNVLLESIACGTRFVATDVGGIPAIATPGVDALVPAGDSAALASALLRAIAVPPASIERRATPGSWHDAAGSIAAALNNAIARKRNRRAGRGIELARLSSMTAESDRSPIRERRAATTTTNSAA
jgi:glycosyltransferase involved in cell wall biosynthesis